MTRVLDMELDEDSGGMLAGKREVDCKLKPEHIPPHEIIVDFTRLNEGS